MKSKEFEKAKVSMAIKRSGQEFIFKRYKKNDLNENTNEFEEDVILINGLYHEQNSSIQRTVSNEAITRTKKVPMILCLLDNIVESLKSGDITVINNKVYEYIGYTDIDNLGVISDITLELIDNG